MVDTRSLLPTMSSTVMVTVSPVFQWWGPSWNRPSRIFRALQVGHDGQRLAGRVGRVPQPVVDDLVVGVVAVREVHPGHVHPGIEQSGNGLR